METSQESAVQLLKRVRGVSRLLASVLPQELPNPEDKAHAAETLPKRAGKPRKGKKDESQ